MVLGISLSELFSENFELFVAQVECVDINMDSLNFLQEVTLGTSADIDIHLDNNVLSIVFLVLLTFQNDV